MMANRLVQKWAGVVADARKLFLDACQVKRQRRAEMRCGNRHLWPS